MRNHVLNRLGKFVFCLVIHKIYVISTIIFIVKVFCSLVFIFYPYYPMKNKESIKSTIVRKLLWKERKLSHKAVTIVEIVVVVIVLIILWVIAYISISQYSQKARNSARVSDINTMMDALEEYALNTSFYPISTDWVEITYSWSEVRTQSVFWKPLVDMLNGLSKELKDPLTWSNYAYSRLNTRKEYEIGSIMEWEISMNTIVDKTYADSGKIAYSYIQWTYNWVVATVETGSLEYILAVPTIISWDVSLTDIIEQKNKDRFAYHKSNNLPDSYKNSWFKMTSDEEVFSPDSILVYVGSKQSLLKTENQIKLLKELQDIYNTTSLTNKGPIKDILSVLIDEDNPSSEAKTLASLFTQNNLNPNVTVYNDSLDNIQEKIIIPENTDLWCSWIDFNKAYNNSWWFFNSPMYPNEWAFVALKSDWKIVVWGKNSWWWSWVPDGNNYIQIASTSKAFAALKTDWSITAWWSFGLWWGWEPTDSGYERIFSNKDAFAALKTDWSIVSWWNPAYGWEWAPTDSWYEKIFSTEQAFAALKSDWSIVSWGNPVKWWEDTPTGTWYTDIFSTEQAFAALKSDWSIIAWWNQSYGWEYESTTSWYTSIVSTEWAFAALKPDWTIKAWWSSIKGGVWEPTGSWYTQIFSNERAFAALKSDWSISVWWDESKWWSWAPTDNWYIKIYSTEWAFAALKSDWSISVWWHSSYGWTDGPEWTGYTEIFSSSRAFVALKDWMLQSWWGSSWWWNWAPIDAGYVNVYSTDKAFVAIKSDWDLSAWWNWSWWWDDEPQDKGYISVNWICKEYQKR